MAFHDPAVYAGGKPEIIRIHDQSPHIASVAAAAIVSRELRPRGQQVQSAESDYCGIVYNRTR